MGWSAAVFDRRVRQINRAAELATSLVHELPSGTHEERLVKARRLQELLEEYNLRLRGTR
jgi:hypothetical protein